MSERIFGHIPGYPEGSHFEARIDLSKAGVHRPTVAGISGSERDGADSIVLSGGYEDGEDLGDEIVYTGHGGRDPETGKQVADQNFSRGNRALAHSSLRGLPVRVIRGWGHDSPYSPSAGYRYDPVQWHRLYPADGFGDRIPVDPQFLKQYSRQQAAHPNRVFGQVAGSRRAAMRRVGEVSQVVPDIHDTLYEAAGGGVHDDRPLCGFVAAVQELFEALALKTLA